MGHYLCEQIVHQRSLQKVTGQAVIFEHERQRETAADLISRSDGFYCRPCEGAKPLSSISTTYCKFHSFVGSADKELNANGQNFADRA